MQPFEAHFRGSNNKELFQAYLYEFDVKVNINYLLLYTSKIILKQPKIQRTPPALSDVAADRK